MACSKKLINERGNIKKTYESADNSAKTKEKEACHLSVGQRCNIDHETGAPFDPIVSSVTKATTMTPFFSNLDPESDGARRLRQDRPFTSDKLNISKDYNQVENTEEANFEERGTDKQKVLIPNKDNDDSVPNTNPMTKTVELDGKSGDIICSKMSSARNPRGTHTQELIEYSVKEPLKQFGEERPKKTKSKKKNEAKKTKCVDKDETAACPTDGQENSSYNTKPDSVDVVSLAELGIPEQYIIKSSAGDICVQITKKLQAPDLSEHAVEQVSSVQHSIPLKTATVQVHSAAIEEETTAIIYATVQTATTTEQFSAQATAAQDQVSFQTTIVAEDAFIQMVTGIDDVSVHTAAVTEQVSAQATAAQDQVSFQTTIVAEDALNQTVTGIDDVSVHTAAVTEQVSAQATAAQDQVSFQTTIVAENALIQMVTGIDDVSVHTAAVTEQVSAQATAAQDQVSFQTTIVAENAFIQMVTGIDDVSVHTAAVTEQVSAHSTAAVDQILFHTAVVTEDVSIQTATTIHDVSVHTAEATDVIEQVPVQTVLVTDVSVQTAVSATSLGLQQTRSEPFNDGTTKTASAEGPEELQTDQQKRHQASGMDPQQPLWPFGQQVSSSSSSPHHVLPQQTSTSPERSGSNQAPVSSCPVKDTLTLETFHQSELSRPTEAHTENVQQSRAISVETFGHQTATPRHPEIQTSEEVMPPMQPRRLVAVHSTRPDENFPYNEVVPRASAIDARGVMQRRENRVPEHHVQGSHVPGIRLRRGTPVHPGVRQRRVRPREPVVDLRASAVDLQDTRDLAADVDVRQPGLHQSGLPQAVRGASGLRIHNSDWVTSDMSADERGRLPSQLRHLLDHELMAMLSQDLGSRRGPVVVTCVVCISRPVSVLTFNCLHRVICIVCFLQRRLRRCPLLWCQRPILFYWSSGSQ